jgi:hypothetical protein
MKALLLTTLVVFTGSALAASDEALVTKSSIVAGTDEKDFKPLFNGKDLTGWHLRKADGHNSWKVEDGILKNVVEKGQHGTDLVGDQKFWNFTVRYEYQVPDNSNSGFYLRGRHEIQIFGDYPKGKSTKGGNGAIYQLALPTEFASKPGDQWQTVEATMIDNKVTVILNGKKIHDNVTVDKATGSELDANLTEPGPFFLQGDHGTVSFRNIRVKELPKTAAK